MSKLIWLAGLGVAGVMVFAATSRGDDGMSSEPSQAPPSLDASSSSAQGHGAPLSFSFGPPEAAWSYEQLSSEEKAIVDRGRDTTAWQQVNDLYAGAAREHAKEAEATLAARMLQIDDLGDLGVVP